MCAQPPVKPPWRAPYEDALSTGLSHLKDHPVLAFGVLVMLIAVILMIFSPQALFTPFPYVLLGFGVFLVLLDYLSLSRLRAAKRDGNGTPPGPGGPSEVPEPPETEPTPVDVLRCRYLESLIANCCRSRLVGLDP